jgi:hypothetical protein
VNGWNVNGWNLHGWKMDSGQRHPWQRCFDGTERPTLSSLAAVWADCATGMNHQRVWGNGCRTTRANGPCHQTFYDLHWGRLY